MPAVVLQATVTAARLAKLNVLKLINEPTAAALAFGCAIIQKSGSMMAMFVALDSKYG
jgi:molecular chaperone DnaK (HSP70)